MYNFENFPLSMNTFLSSLFHLSPHLTAYLISVPLTRDGTHAPFAVETIES